MAHNLAVDFWRRHRRETSLAEDAGPPLVDAQSRRMEERAALSAFIERFVREALPGKWAPVFQARFVEQLDQREAARRLGMHRTTLAYRELRIRKLLRAYLRKEVLTMNACEESHRWLIDGHFAGRLSRAKEARLRAHLPDCPSCRESYETYLVAEQLDPKGANPRARLGIALGLPKTSASAGLGRGSRFGLGMLALASVAGLVLFLTRGPTSQNDFMPRGSVTGTSSSDLDLAVFRVKGDRESQRVRDRVSARDELAFAYRNERGKAFLMIFAVDTAGRVAWYHPEWTDPASNPKAISITKQVGFKELPEAVRQPLQGDRIALHALFMDSAVDVRSIEARVTRAAPLTDIADAAAGEIDRKLVLAVTQ